MITNHEPMGEGCVYMHIQTNLPMSVRAVMGQMMSLSDRLDGW